MKFFSFKTCFFFVCIFFCDFVVSDRTLCSTRNIARISEFQFNITNICGDSCPVGEFQYEWRCGKTIPDVRPIYLYCRTGCFYPNGVDKPLFDMAYDLCMEEYKKDDPGNPEYDYDWGYWLCSSECYQHHVAFGGNCNDCVDLNEDRLTGEKCNYCKDHTVCSPSPSEDCLFDDYGWGPSVCDSQIGWIQQNYIVLVISLALSLLMFIVQFYYVYFDKLEM